MDRRHHGSKRCIRAGDLGVSDVDECLTQEHLTFEERIRVSRLFLDSDGHPAMLIQGLGFCKAAQQLRNPREMSISCDECQVMFQRERRDPQIVVRNRCTGVLELHKQSRIVVRRFPAREQDSNGILREQPPQ
jgi:hypothetical protein